MRNARLLLVPALFLLAGLPAAADDWPGWLGPQRDAVWRETGILEKFPSGGPKVLWRKSIGGGYAGPAVANGKVYVTDRVLEKGQREDKNPFKRANSKGEERVLCFDATTGKELWKVAYPSKYTMSYPCGPRTTPVVHQGKVYTLGGMGDLLCLDAGSGKKLWSKQFMTDYDAEVPLWGFSAHPLIDGDNLICLVGKSPVVVAFNKDTGKEVWRSLKLDNAQVGYCPPVIYTLGKKRHLVIWHPEAVVGLDPATGKELWSHPWSISNNLTISTPRQVGDNRLFVTAFYNGCRLLEITEDGDGKCAVKAVWQSKARGERPGQTDKLHSIMSTPYIKDGHIYGVCSYGELRCLDLKTGTRQWSELTASGAGKAPERWANAFLVAQGDRFFLFNELGELVIARLTPKGYQEIDRTKILEPTGQLAGGFSSARKIVWTHPAFANRAMFARNDNEIVAVSLAAPQ